VSLSVLLFFNSLSGRVFVCLFVLSVFGFVFCLFIFLFFRDRVSLCSPGCPGTHSVDQAGLKLRNPPACAGIKGVRHHCPQPLAFQFLRPQPNHILHTYRAFNISAAFWFLSKILTVQKLELFQ
jgi:hypothetical protein